MDEVTYKAILRDQFAMRAMQGLLSNEACMRELLRINDNPQFVAKKVAERAYLYADEMMKQTIQTFESI